MILKSRLKEITSALRSGEYTQHRGGFVSFDGASHCALGVMYDLFAKTKGQRAEEHDLKNNNIKDWLGGSEYDLWYAGQQHGIKSIPTLNDAGASFEEIAAILEEHVETYEPETETISTETLDKTCVMC